MAFPILYELNTRCWLRELALQAGCRVTLSNVPEPLVVEWARRGFTHIWLMGVWTSGPAAREQALTSTGLFREFDLALPDWVDQDVAGSPYAIAAYLVPRNLGGESGLKKFRRLLRKYGLKLVLDFVPNHVGLGHPWVRARPGLFVPANALDPLAIVVGPSRSPARLSHGRDPHFPPWADTVQLDYRRPDTRAFMIEELKRLAARCDGVRCDMAMLLLNDVFGETWRNHPCRDEVATGEFWSQAIAGVRGAHPDFLLLAEAYWNRERDLLNLGFDFAYHKRVADAICEQPESVQQELLDSRDWLVRGAHFLENHDERRAADRLTPATHRVAAFVMLTLPGLRFLHEGQLAGWKVRTPVQLGRRFQEPADPAVEAIYDQLLSTLQNTAVGRGTGELLAPRPAWDDNPTTKWFVLVQWQGAPDEFYLAVANLAPHRSQCYAPLTVAHLARHDWQLFDVLGGQGHERGGDELRARGLFLDVPAHAAQLFQFRPLT